jgi:predicted metal-binding membrane protein
LTAARARLGLIALLFALAGLAWWSTAVRMDGMGGDLGTLGWFLGFWVVMMAAMMLPSVAPTVAVYARMAQAVTPVAPLAFAGGYLLTWTAAGLVAYAVYEIAGDSLRWDHGGHWVAAGALVAAALYELTALKHACLRKCRHPLGFLATTWRDGLAGAVDMGVRHGAWCVGCCWALMASLFALGVMSLAWMALVAALIALEKTLPWERVATFGTSAVLLVLGAGLAAGLL